MCNIMKERNTKNLTTKGESELPQQRNVLPAFALFGLFFISTTYVILSGTQDILSGTHKPSTIVLLASVIPILIVDIVAPYFISRIPNILLISITCITISVGLIIVAYAVVDWKIAGAGLSTFGIAVGSITVVSLTSFYEPSVVSAYSTGTGVGFLAGPVYYTGKNKKVENLQRKKRDDNMLFSHVRISSLW